jgi:hypothetical protein
MTGRRGNKNLREQNREKKMKKLLTIIATLSLFAVAGVGTARAQVIDAVVAEIPFDFNIGDTSLPPGKYTVGRCGSMTGRFLAISNDEGKILRLFLVEAAEANKPPQQAELIFHRVGDQYFLYEIFDPGSQIGAELPEPRAERQLEKKAAVTGGSSYVTVAGLNSER